MLEQCEFRGHPAVRLKNDLISVVVVPKLGGKIASLKRTGGREWLWQNHSIEPTKASYGESFVEKHDTGGWDECVPTVDPCTLSTGAFEGVSLPDHGELFCQEWQILSENSLSLSLEAKGVNLPYRFHRTITLPDSGDRLLLQYECENLSQHEMPFGWCCHPLLAIEPGMRIDFPENSVARLASAIDDFPGSKETYFSWPTVCGVRLDSVTNPGAEEFRAMGAKVFVGPLSEGWTQIGDEDEKLRFEFSLSEIEHVAMWMNFGAWAGVGDEPYFNLGFEPCIGAYDSLDEPYQKGHNPVVLMPGETRRWQLTVRLVSSKIGR